MFSLLLVTCFLLFHQQIIIPTAGYSFEYNEEDTNGELLAITEPDGLWNSSTLPENSTEIYSTTEKVESPDNDDVIELNIGGQKMTTLRSTLTVVPNSKLARMFSKDNTEKKLPMDKQGAVFFDYNPIYFNYLLDQLRAIKRMPKKSAYDVDIIAPRADIRSNFSIMISDLGLNPDHFLSPLAGTHLNLNISSLIGWQECYRSRYKTPFDSSILTKSCRSTRLLVACRPVGNRKTLTLAGVGKWENIFRLCSPNTHCASEMKDGTSFYYVTNQAWGFEGRPKDLTPGYTGYNYNGQFGTQHSSYLNPCDSSDYNSEYRLCWSVSSSINRGGGDRCGSVKNLHNETGWERIIYRAI